jgi:hypothetical protein
VGRSPIGTLVERSTRFTILLYFPPMADQGPKRVHNGSVLAGYEEEAVRDATTGAIVTLPQQLRPLSDLGPGRQDGPTCPVTRLSNP